MKSSIFQWTSFFFRSNKERLPILEDKYGDTPNDVLCICIFVKWAWDGWNPQKLQNNQSDVYRWILVDLTLGVFPNAMGANIESDVLPYLIRYV